SIVEHEGELGPAIELAFRYEPPGPNARVLVEERLVGRELTVAVIGNDELQPLPVIEIKTKRAFFDYSAKYDAGESEEICPAAPQGEMRALRDLLRALRRLIWD